MGRTRVEKRKQSPGGLLGANHPKNGRERRRGGFGPDDDGDFHLQQSLPVKPVEQRKEQLLAHYNALGNLNRKFRNGDQRRASR
jgi:hypothetical protein